jgi:hypothetical protein
VWAVATHTLCPSASSLELITFSVEEVARGEFAVASQLPVPRDVITTCASTLSCEGVRWEKIDIA